MLATTMGRTHNLLHLREHANKYNIVVVTSMETQKIINIISRIEKCMSHVIYYITDWSGLKYT